MQFTEEEIQAVVHQFFDFEYWYTYAHCSCQNCKRKITTTVTNPGKPNQQVNTSVSYYCDVEHRWLNGEVTNFTLEDVLAVYNFNSTEMTLFSTYHEQVELLIGGNG